MYITKDELEKKERVLKKREVFVQRGGRSIGAKNLSEEQRAALGFLAGKIGPRAAAEIEGVSYQTAWNAKEGIVGTNGYTNHKDEKIVEKIEEKEDKIADRALSLVMESLNTITPEKMEELGVKDAAIVAEKLSSIAGGRRGEAKSGTQVFIHIPVTKELKDYPVVAIKAEQIS